MDDSKLSNEHNLIQNDQFDNVDFKVVTVQKTEHRTITSQGQHVITSTYSLGTKKVENEQMVEIRLDGDKAEFQKVNNNQSSNFQELRIPLKNPETVTQVIIETTKKQQFEPQNNQPVPQSSHKYVDNQIPEGCQKYDEQKEKEELDNTDFKSSMLCLLLFMIVAIVVIIFMCLALQEAQNQVGKSIIQREKKISDFLKIYSQSEYNKDDIEVAQYFYNKLNLVFPSQMDLLVIFALFLSTYVFQQIPYVNVLLFGKDLFCLVIVYGELNDKYGDMNAGESIMEWGYFFCRFIFNPCVFLPFAQIFYLRLTTFRYLAMGGATAAVNIIGGLTKEQLSIVRKTSFLIPGTATPDMFLFLAYLGVCSLLCIANSAGGGVILFLGIFGVWVLNIFGLLFKELIYSTFFKNYYRYRISSENCTQMYNKPEYKNSYVTFYLNGDKKPPLNLNFTYDENQSYLVGERMRMSSNYYLMYYFGVLLLCLGSALGIAYGSIWYEGVNTGALLRYLYASPYQMTFNLFQQTDSTLKIIARYLAVI